MSKAVPWAGMTIKNKSDLQASQLHKVYKPTLCSYKTKSKMIGLSWMYSIILLLVYILSASGAPIKGRDISFLVNGNNLEGFSVSQRVWIYSLNSGFHLRVVGSKIDFSGTKSDPSTVMILESVNIKGHISIKAEQENSFICVNTKDGTLVLETQTYKSNRCLFVEDQYLGFTQIKSVYNPKWFIGSKRSGHIKQPSKTGRGQKAVLLMDIRLP